MSKSETEKHKRGAKEVDEYQPFPVWKRARITDHPEKAMWTNEQWEKSWDETLKNPLTEKIWTRNQWCIGEFKGIQISAGQSREFHNTMQSVSNAENAEELGDLAAAGAEAAQRWQRQASSSVPQIQPVAPRAKLQPLPMPLECCSIFNTRSPSRPRRTKRMPQLQGRRHQQLAQMSRPHRKRKHVVRWCLRSTSNR